MIVSANSESADPKPDPRPSAAVNDSELIARRLGDLAIIRANQEARLARLGLALAEALQSADSSERALRAATLERARLGTEQAALRAKITAIGNEADSLRVSLSAKAAQVSAMESSRAWRLRTQVLRARIWIEAHFRRLSPPLPSMIPPAEAPTLDASSLVTSQTAAIASAQRTVGPPTSDAARRGRKSVVFISHDAQPHGAQIFLLRLLRWFRDHSELEFEIILGGGGPLEPDFAAIARVSSFPSIGPGALPEDDPLIRRLRDANVGLIYANTITNGRLMGALATLRCPAITHVHELGFWIKNRVRPDELRIVLDCSARFIAVSDAVRQVLVDSVGVPPAKVAVVHECVPVHGEPSPPPAERESAREQLGIPKGAPVVMGCGTLDWRKAPDLFVMVARRVREGAAGRPVHFVWVGGSRDGGDLAALRHDIERTGLTETMHFVAHCDNPRLYFAISDVFALTSREDPFPLVVLEAATAGVPTVCFDASGGAREFVESDAGFVVPYLDAAAMADRISEILASPELRRSLGERARNKVAERHDLDLVAPVLLREIEGLLGDPVRPPNPEP